MMISPEVYYQMNLKDKSQPEILKEIRSLKREINQLRRDLEECSLEPEPFFPSRLTRLKCNREYLDRAILTYEETGGKYVLTKDEKKSRDFDRALDSLHKLVFSIGGYFGGFETKTYTVIGDKVVLKAEHTFKRLPVICYPLTKEEFVSGLKEIHIGEWRKSYCAPHELDGTQWEMEIYFEGNRKAVRISGSNAFPYNFIDLKEFLEIDEEDAEDTEDETPFR